VPIPPDITSAPQGFFIRAPGALGSPSAVLADNIDPHTRDFASLFLGANVIDAQVQLAMTVIRASGASVNDDGIAPSPRKMTNSYQAELTTDARTALGRLVRQGDITIVGVLFDLDDETNQTTQMRVRYRNLRAADAVVREAAVPVPGQAEAVI